MVSKAQVVQLGCQAVKQHKYWNAAFRGTLRVWRLFPKVASKNSTELQEAIINSAQGRKAEVDGDLSRSFRRLCGENMLKYM